MTWAGPGPRWCAGCTRCCASWSPAGSPKAITAAAAARLLGSITPAGAVDAARCELAAAFIEDLRRIDAQLRQTRKTLTAAVQATGTSLTGLFGVGPVIAAAVIGDVKHVSRFPSRDRFAAYNGTAPIEVSSGGRKVYRLSRRGNRRLNHAIHMAAVTQVRHRHSKGRAYYDKKIAEGKTPKEALRSLKRQVSNAIYARLQADARSTAACARGPGGQPGNGSGSSAAACTPQTGSSGKPLPDLATTLRPQPAAQHPARQRPGQSWPFPDRCHPADGEAAGPGGAPAAKRGRTTWTRRETTAILGCGKAPGHDPQARTPRPEGTSRTTKKANGAP